MRVLWTLGQSTSDAGLERECVCACVCVCVMVVVGVEMSDQNILDAGSEYSDPCSLFPLPPCPPYNDGGGGFYFVRAPFFSFSIFV